MKTSEVKTQLWFYVLPGKADWKEVLD